MDLLERVETLGFGNDRAKETKKFLAEFLFALKAGEVENPSLIADRLLGNAGDILSVIFKGYREPCQPHQLLIILDSSECFGGMRNTPTVAELERLFLL